MYNPYIEEIIESLINGNFQQAKEQLQDGCKTKPEEQAYRLAVVTYRLVDKYGKYQLPNTAAVFLGHFND
tara:strand:+ start:457 stop:666 length:210 start_codon:yes stop_codon:yes gene_type:complete